MVKADRETLVHEILSMKERMDLLYRETVQAVQSAEEKEVSPGWQPVADVIENDKEWVAFVDLPGVSQDHFTVELVQNTLILHGTRPELTDGAQNTIVRERPWGPFNRRWSLPENIISEKVSADYRHGVLTIVVPKNPALTRKVPVRADN